MVTPLVTTLETEEERKARLERYWKALLAEKDISQAEAARRMGVSRAQLTRLLKGDREWTSLTARAFAVATKIPMREVFEEVPA